MRVLSLLLVALVGLIQHPLWLGQGGWLRVWELDREVAARDTANRLAAQRNAALEAEVRDLRQGSVALEERARYELGFVRPDEVFVQITEPKVAPAPEAPRDTRTAALR